MAGALDNCGDLEILPAQPDYATHISSRKITSWQWHFIVFTDQNSHKPKENHSITNVKIIPTITVIDLSIKYSGVNAYNIYCQPSKNLGFQGGGGSCNHIPLNQDVMCKVIFDTCMFL